MRWAMSRPQRAYCGNALRTRSQNRLATRNSPVLFRLERLIRRRGSTWVSHDIVSNSSQRAKSNLECWYEALPARIAIGGSRFASILNFETEHTGTTPRGWGGGPPGTIFVDGNIVHSGRWAVRLERDTASPQGFTTITNVLPADFAG